LPYDLVYPLRITTPPQELSAGCAGDSNMQLGI